MRPAIPKDETGGEPCPAIASRPEFRLRAAERGFTIIEMTIALFVTAEVILAGLALFDFHNKLARVQTQVSDMQQSLRVAQYDLVRMTRMAGRGGFPAVLQSHAGVSSWGGVAVRSNVAAGADQVAIGYSGSPLAVDGTDILALRGVFTSPIYQVNSTNAASLTLAPTPNSPTTATAGTVVVCAYTSTGVAQNLGALITAVQGGKSEAIMMVSPLNDALFAVVELNPAASTVVGNQASCTVPSWVATAPNPNGIVLAFNVTGDALAVSFQAMSATASNQGLPAAMTTVAWLGILEEYRYYVRQDYFVPGNAATDWAPHLSRARLFPGTETAYQGNVANLQADVADNVLDLQISLGVDPNGDGVITESNPPDDKDEWLGNSIKDVLTPFNGLVSQQPLREVRISTLVQAGNRDFQYVGPLLTNVEDHVYKPTDFPNTPQGRAHRHRLLQTVVGLRNM